MFNRKIILTSLLAIILGIAVQPTFADWSVTGPMNSYDEQNIVIVVSENPRQETERVCLAITLAKALANNDYRPNNVTIFATLDGTALGIKSMLKKRRLKCIQGDGSEIALKENLEQFLYPDDEADGDNNLVLCPLCYKERFDDKEPDYGVLPGFNAPGNAVIEVLANADKVIDF